MSGWAPPPRDPKGRAMSREHTADAEANQCDQAQDYAAFLRVIKRIQYVTGEPDRCPEPLRGLVFQQGPPNYLCLTETTDETLTLESGGYSAKAPAALVNGGDIRAWVDKQEAAKAAEDRAMAEQAERWERKQLANLKRKYEDGDDTGHDDEEIPV